MDTKQQSTSMLEMVTQSIKNFEQATQPTILPTSSSPEEVIEHLISCARPIDFDAIANNPDGKKANVIQKTVITIDEFKKIADQNNRNITIIKGEIFIYNGVYWQNLEENEAKYLLGKVAEAMNYDSIDSQFYRTRDRLYNQLHSAAYTP